MSDHKQISEKIEYVRYDHEKSFAEIKMIDGKMYVCKMSFIDFSRFIVAENIDDYFEYSVQPKSTKVEV